MKITTTKYQTLAAAPKATKVPARLLDAAAQYKTKKRWTGFDLTDGEKDDIREAIRAGSTAVEAAKAAM